MSLIAIVVTLNAGYDAEKQKMIDLGIKVGDRFTVRTVDMGQSNTSIYLEEHSSSFNSVFFEFEENGEEINIYSDPRYNPYLSMYDNCDEKTYNKFKTNTNKIFNWT